MEDDIERLKDLRDTLKEAGEAKGHAHMQPKYCKEMAKVLERHIETQETSCVRYWVIDRPQALAQDDFF